ncbi:MAG TPA: hypothetical protein VII22_23670 [Streptosporangiaceae bacterium]
MHCDIPRSAGGRPAIAEDGRWLGSLRDELQALLAPLFCQARSRLTAFAYLDALLAEPGDRRSCWQLAEAAGHWPEPATTTSRHASGRARDEP